MQHCSSGGWQQGCAQRCPSRSPAPRQARICQAWLRQPAVRRHASSSPSTRLGSSRILFPSQLRVRGLHTCFKGCSNCQRNTRGAATHHVGVSLPGPPLPAHVHRHHVSKRLRSLSGPAHDPVEGTRAGGQPCRAHRCRLHALLVCRNGASDGAGEGQAGDTAGMGTGTGTPALAPQHSRLGDDVSVGQRHTLRAADPDGTEDVAEAAAQVPAADGQQRTPCQRPAQRLDLQHQGKGWRQPPRRSLPSSWPPPLLGPREDDGTAPRALAPPTARPPPRSPHCSFAHVKPSRFCAAFGSRVWSGTTPAADTPGVKHHSLHTTAVNGGEAETNPETQTPGAGMLLCWEGTVLPPCL